MNPSILPPRDARSSELSPRALRVAVLQSARDNRGSLAGVPASLLSTVADLARAGLLETDVFGFRITQAGTLYLARVEEQALAGR